MPDANDPLPLLNVFEVSDDQGGTRHLLAFLEPVRAGSAGIDPRSIVGEITPTDGGGYDPRSLKLNPEFIEAFTDYMNEVQAVTPEIIAQARTLPSGWVYIIDPRHVDEPGRPAPDRPRRRLRRRRHRPGRPEVVPVQRQPRPDRPGAGDDRPLLRPAVLRLAAPAT